MSVRDWWVNSELTFDGLIRKENGSSRCSVCFGDLWVNKVSVSYLQQLDLKIKIKTWHTVPFLKISD